MGRTEAIQLHYAITRNRLNINPLGESEEKLLNDLIGQPIKTVKKIKNLLGPINIEQLCPEFFSRYSRFYVFGCPASTDIDVIVVIDNKYMNNGSPLPLFSDEYQRMKDELSEMSYDVVSRSIDYNLIVVENGYIVGQSKGGMDTANILIRTHHLHPQKYAYDLELHFVQSTVPIRIRSTAKFIMDYLEYGAIDYQSIRQKKIAAYSESTYIEFSLTILNMIHLNTSMLNAFQRIKWHDYMKSITMKILQLALLYYHSEYEYVKENLASLSEKFNFNPTNTMWFLFRGNRGEFNDQYLPRLFELYNTIVSSYESSKHYVNIMLPKSTLTNNTEITDSLFEQFIESPNEPTPDFGREFTETYPDNNINQLFPIMNSNIEHLSIPHQIKEKFIQVPQRSEEWLKLLNFYVCGNNSASIKNTIDGTYNLLRGSITESLIIEHFQPSMIGLSADWQKIQVGLLVEEVGRKGARGCSPDLLLVRDNQIIPVEIKTLHSLTKNKDYCRGCELAYKQVNSVRQILDPENKYNLFTHFLIILACYSETDLILECQLNKFE